jgi:hypothetical protein
MGRDDEIADLKQQVAELKKAVAPPKSAAQRMQEDREYMSKLHASREARMNHASPPMSAEQAKAYTDAAGGPAGVRDLVQHGTIPGPGGQIPTTGQVGPVHSSPGIGRGSGWVTPPPLGPPPGINYVDAQMDAQDKLDRAELEQKLGRKG